jgi:uncharacterized protein (UPF0332 family)
MPCQPRDVFRIATLIFESSEKSDEAACRSVTSRAYYAVLNRMKEVFGDVERVDSPTESSHRKIIDRASMFGRQRAPGSDIAARLVKLTDKLRRDRNDADYELDEDHPHKKASDSMTMAKELLSMCDMVELKRKQARSR